MDTVQLFCKIASSGQISVWEYFIVDLIGGVFDATEFLQPQPPLQNGGLWMCVNILNIAPSI